MLAYVDASTDEGSGSPLRLRLVRDARVGQGLGPSALPWARYKQKAGAMPAEASAPKFERAPLVFIAQKMEFAYRHAERSHG